MSEAVENNEQPMSFREATASRLRDEWQGKQETAPTSEDRERVTQEAPTPPEDDYEDVETLEASENVPDEEAPTEEAELDEEPTDSDGAEDESEEGDFRTKYEELEKEYRRVTANRKQIEADRAQEAEAFVRMKHEFDDTSNDLMQKAEFYSNLPKQTLNQLSQVNPATLPAEQQAMYYQQLNAATQQAQQLEYQLSQIKAQREQQMETMRQREAEIADARLKASIPEWSKEHYAELGRVATEAGYSAEEYAQITDPRMIELFHARWKSEKASEAVKTTVKQRKAQPPQSRSANQQPRNKRGQYEKAKKEFQPNQRGSFAAMKQAQWDTERQ